VVVKAWIYIVSLQSLKQSGNVNQNSINMESIDLLFDKRIRYGDLIQDGGTHVLWFWRTNNYE